MSALRLIATREFTERLRSRAFLISNAVVIGLLILSIAVPAFTGDDGPVELGVVGGDASRVADIAALQQGTFQIELELAPLAGRSSAEAALDEHEVDAVLLDGRTVLVARTIDPELEALLSNAANTVQVDDRLTEAGLDEAERRDLFAIEPLEVRSRADSGEVFDPFAPQVVVAFIGVFLLYGLLAIYGQWVAQGIVEEKQSRVVEVLLSTVRPTELLTGKIVGLGLLGFAQILLLAAVGLAGITITGAVDLPNAGYGGLALVIAWYIPGYLLYATLFAAAGAVVSRVEDLQATVTPVIVVLVLAILGAQTALADPTSTVATIAGLVPFSAPIVQPLLAASEVASVWGMLLAFALAIATIAVMLPVCGRIYRGGILATRTRVSFRAAWGAERRGAVSSGR